MEKKHQKNNNKNKQQIDPKIHKRGKRVDIKVKDEKKRWTH